MNTFSLVTYFRGHKYKKKYCKLIVNLRSYSHFHNHSSSLRHAAKDLASTLGETKEALDVRYEPELAAAMAELRRKDGQYEQETLPDKCTLLFKIYNYCVLAHYLSPSLEARGHFPSCMQKLCLTT